MKKLSIFFIILILPVITNGQLLLRSRNKFTEFAQSRPFYIGTDAYIRRENIKLVESGQTIAPSNWMWNLSYGFNVGYQPNQWLTLESGLYRFTFARRVNFRFGVHPGRSFSTPWTVNTIPVRVYFNPFASRQNQHTRNKIQLVAGFSYGSLMKYEGEPTGSFGGLRRYFINDIVVDSLTFESTDQITNGRVLNLEGGVNVSRRLSSRLTVSATYGFTYGLNQVHRQNIQYRLSSTGQDYQGQQTSNGSSRTVLFGLKYHLGKYPNSNRTPDLHKSQLPLH